MKLTREGRRFLLAALLITAAAVNTGNNLIYLILSLMLSFLLLSWLILRVNLAGLSADLKISGPVFAEDRINAQLSVFNNKRIPAYSLVIGSADSGDPVYFGEIKANGASVKDLWMVFRKRGEYGYGGFTVQSGFPFILFRKEMPVRIAGSVLVYPKLIEAVPDELDIRGNQETGAVYSGTGGDDIHSLRKYREGDDWRRIHWKASARHFGLLVREHAEYASEKVSIVLDNLPPKDPLNFETAVSVAASAVKHFIDKGSIVRIIAAGESVPFGSGEEHLFRMLDMLALIRENDSDSLQPDALTEGLIIAVLKSGQSGLGAHTLNADRVFYADTI